MSAVLGDIFGSAPEEEAAPPPSALALNGLDAPLTALVRDLVGRDHLTEADFATLCESHGLMEAGALEAVNEWSFDSYDDALLDAYDGYDVAPDIAAAIRADFEKGGHDVQTETARA